MKEEIDVEMKFLGIAQFHEEGAPCYPELHDKWKDVAPITKKEKGLQLKERILHLRMELIATLDLIHEQIDDAVDNLDWEVLSQLDAQVYDLEMCV